MEVKLWAFDEFPAFPTDEAPAGVTLLPTTGDEAGARYLHDVEYRTAGGYALKLQILLPRSRNKPYAPPPPPELQMPMLPSTATKPEPPLPCLVYVQGSAWMEQDVYGNLSQLAAMARRGYAVAVVQYRHSGIAAYPAQAIDARNAVRFLRLHAKDFFLDPARFFIGGDSSGGHTALMAAIRHNDDMDENAYPGISGDTLGVIDLYGSVSVLEPDGNPTTLNHHLPDSPEGMVMGFINLLERPDLCRELTVETHITPDTVIPPVLMFHGTKDRIVNTRQSISLYNRLKACGKEATLYLLDGADHGGTEFWSEAMLDIMVGFLQKCER